MSSAPSQLAARTQIARDGRRCGPLSLRPCCGCADAVSAAGGEVAGSAATVEARRPCLFARDRACATMPPCMRECALVMRVGSAVQRAAASSILPVMIAPVTMLGALGTPTHSTKAARARAPTNRTATACWYLSVPSLQGCPLPGRAEPLDRPLVPTRKGRRLPQCAVSHVSVVRRMVRAKVACCTLTALRRGHRPPVRPWAAGDPRLARDLRVARAECGWHRLRRRRVDARQDADLAAAVPSPVARFVCCFVSVCGDACASERRLLAGSQVASAVGGAAGGCVVDLRQGGAVPGYVGGGKTGGQSGMPSE